MYESVLSGSSLWCSFFQNEKELPVVDLYQLFSFKRVPNLDLDVTELLLRLRSIWVSSALAGSGRVFNWRNHFLYGVGTFFQIADINWTSVTQEKINKIMSGLQNIELLEYLSLKTILTSKLFYCPWDLYAIRQLIHALGNYCYSFALHIEISSIQQTVTKCTKIVHFKSSIHYRLLNLNLKRKPAAFLVRCVPLVSEHKNFTSQFIWNKISMSLNPFRHCVLHDRRLHTVTTNQEFYEP